MLEIEVVASTRLSPETRAELLQLFREAYGEDLTSYLDDIGPGLHYLGREAGALVSHAVWVTRWLRPGEGPPLKTAYVEMVATHPQRERRGFASALLRRLVEDIEDSHDLAALSPATSEIYLRMGWRFWEGPVALRARCRREGVLVAASMT